MTKTKTKQLEAKEHLNKKTKKPPGQEGQGANE